MPAGAQLKAACPIGAVEDRGLKAGGIPKVELLEFVSLDATNPLCFASLVCN